jgi:hypothetical protein
MAPLMGRWLVSLKINRRLIREEMNNMTKKLNSIISIVKSVSTSAEFRAMNLTDNFSSSATLA